MYGYPLPLDKVADQKDRELRKAKAEERAAEFEYKLSSMRPGPKTKNLPLYTRVKFLGNLAEQYYILGEVEKMRDCLHRLISVIRSDLHTMSGSALDKLDLVMYWFRRAHVFLAQHEFPAFLKIMEWEFSEENKFFANRICVMGEWAKELEKLEFGEYDLLGLSAPPR